MPTRSSRQLQNLRTKEQFYQHRDAAKAEAAGPRLFTLRNWLGGLHIVTLVVSFISLVLLGVTEDLSWQQVLKIVCSACLVVAVAFLAAATFIHIRIQRAESAAESRVWSDLMSELLPG